MKKDQKIQFTHKGTIRKENGEIAAYEIEVHDICSGENDLLQVKPCHLISHTSMKRILMERKIFYSSSKQEHTESIEAMFDTSAHRV